MKGLSKKQNADSRGFLLEDRLAASMLEQQPFAVRG
jgi:hypothetical protein